MLFQVALLRECSITPFNSTDEWSLVSVTPQMIEEFVQTGENLATIVLEVTFKQAVLFLVAFTFLKIKEGEVLAVGNVALEAQVILDIDIFTSCYVNSVMRLDLIIFNELLA